MVKRRLLGRLFGPLVAALVVLGIVAVPGVALASPTLFCNYVFNDSTHGSITLPATSPETQCVGGSFGGAGYINLRMVITAACASSVLESDSLRLRFNSDSTTGAYLWTEAAWDDGGTFGHNGNNNDSAMTIGSMPCRKSGNAPHGAMTENVEVGDFPSSNLDKEVTVNFSDLAYASGTQFHNTGLFGGVWLRGTGPAAITSVTVFPTISNFEQNSRIALYLE